MTRLKLYAITLVAQRTESDELYRFVSRPAACVAWDLEGALVRGLAAARETYPSKDDWTGHNAWATEIPAELIDIVHSQEVTNA